MLKYWDLMFKKAAVSTANLPFVKTNQKIASFYGKAFLKGLAVSTVLASSMMAGIGQVKADPGAQFDLARSEITATLKNVQSFKPSGDVAMDVQQLRTAFVTANDLLRLETTAFSQLAEKLSPQERAAYQKKIEASRLSVLRIGALTGDKAVTLEEQVLDRGNKLAKQATANLQRKARELHTSLSVPDLSAKMQTIDAAAEAFKTARKSKSTGDLTLLSVPDKVPLEGVLISGENENSVKRGLVKLAHVLTKTKEQTYDRFGDVMSSKDMFSWLKGQVFGHGASHAKSKLDNVEFASAVYLDAAQYALGDDPDLKAALSWIETAKGEGFDFVRDVTGASKAPKNIVHDGGKAVWGLTGDAYDALTSFIAGVKGK